MKLMKYQEASSLFSGRKRVLMIENHRQSLTVMRTLARAGFEPIAGIAIGAKGEDHFVRWSRACYGVFEHPPIAEQKNFLKALHTYCDKHKIAFIFPVGESALTALAADPLRSHLPQTVMPEPNVINLCLDKSKMAEVVAACGVVQPQTARIETLSQAIAAADRLGFPCVIKPLSAATQIRGKKAVFCCNEDELHHCLDVWPSRGPLLMQQKIEGRRINSMFVAKKGQLGWFFEDCVLETDTYDGTGYGVDVVSIEPCAQRRHVCQTLVSELNYQGVGCIQFILDETRKQAYFMEINPRLDAGCALPVHCGIDYPVLAVTCPRVLENPRYPIHRRSQWFTGLLQGVLADQRRGEGHGGVSRLVRGLKLILRFPVHLTWSWKDPLPTLFLYSVFIRNQLFR